ncbi:hypothetical protein GCM10011584_09230 [Nocardioides phosphati]|uniref:DUF4352 domain-containing protein n=2 Tax=Nocardioides phosphati TaxID=1867775 RepID=A0ABQ2NC43_9ACTN|nr:hypothetical protein GCM10011584_09230 [Nocardioides phosphati]
MMVGMRKLIAALAVPLVMASACGGSEKPKATPAHVTVTASASAAQTNEAAPPQVGDGALQIGQVRHGSGIDTTVMEVQIPLRGRPDYLADEPDVFAGIRAKECAHADATESFDIGWSDFALVDPDGSSYPGASESWDDWPPKPHLPMVGTLGAGRCVQGWVLVELPAGAKVGRVALGDPGDPAAEWLLK